MFWLKHYEKHFKVTLFLFANNLIVKNNKAFRSIGKPESSLKLARLCYPPESYQALPVVMCPWTGTGLFLPFKEHQSNHSAFSLKALKCYLRSNQETVSAPGGTVSAHMCQSFISGYQSLYQHTVSVQMGPGDTDKAHWQRWEAPYFEGLEVLMLNSQPMAGRHS